jgi:hypothetical protein
MRKGIKWWAIYENGYLRGYCAAMTAVQACRDFAGYDYDRDRWTAKPDERDDD